MRFNGKKVCAEKNFSAQRHILGCFISCCRSKNTSKIGIFRSFSMKFFFSSKQECMTNTIQSVFLSVTHVFVSILKLFESPLKKLDSQAIFESYLVLGFRSNSTNSFSIKSDIYSSLPFGFFFLKKVNFEFLGDVCQK